MEVVEVQVGREPLSALDGGLVFETVRPFTEKGLDHALDLPVGPRRIRPGELLLDAELLAEGTEHARSKGRTVVGEDSFDADVHASEPGDGSEEKAACGLAVLVVKDASERESRVIVGSDEGELEALLA